MKEVIPGQQPRLMRKTSVLDGGGLWWGGRVEGVGGVGGGAGVICQFISLSKGLFVCKASSVLRFTSVICQFISLSKVLFVCKTSSVLRFTSHCRQCTAFVLLACSQ